MSGTAWFLIGMGGGTVAATVLAGTVELLAVRRAKRKAGERP